MGHNKGKNNPMYGRHHSKKTKKKISKIKKENQKHSENAGNWRGGRRLDVDGYVLIKKRNHPSSNGQGYIAEHRLIAEKVLGRHLKKGEIVHHQNENKQDNRNCNFLICSTGYHTELHGKMRRLEERPSCQ